MQWFVGLCALFGKNSQWSDSADDERHCVEPATLLVAKFEICPLSILFSDLNFVCLNVEETECHL